jgi:hypothetical protein
MTDWYADKDDLLAFARVLVDTEFLQDRASVLDYFAKPWKWTSEFALWTRCGRPQEGDETWDAYYVALDAEVEA